MIGINVASVIILLGVLIFVHELGHFLTAKLSGVGVLKFSLGFGPRLIGRKYGETEYRISLIPLGGYVKLLGESGAEQLSPEDEKRSFLKQPVLKKIGIVAAGPGFNFLFAVLAFAVIYMSGFPTLTNEIGSVQSGSSAQQAGLREGDRITAIDGEKVTTWTEIAEAIGGSKGRELTIQVQRPDGATGDFRLKGRPTTVKNLFGEDAESYKIGIQASTEVVIKRENPVRAVLSGFEQSWAITELTFISIYKIIAGAISPSNLGGPILIAQMAGTQVKKGFLPFIFFMAILSINLAVLNILPIPVLDGGHLFFFLIEMVTGKEINMKWREVAQQIGFFLLILLMLFVFYNDILRIFEE
ncbi:MAG: RIP metalloprotease RseP [Syntrophales bacterium]|nr:RIP metalloprotease RseP [Syntrophales bacterium]MDD5233599.1 RIP metalloprotease RseP [Syntrophales bacterium]MDD5531692.1 RIP metalloprotease RseP [Syntrophales bacterium]